MRIHEQNLGNNKKTPGFSLYTNLFSRPPHNITYVTPSLYIPRYNLTQCGHPAEEWSESDNKAVRLGHTSNRSPILFFYSRNKPCSAGQV
jgi:hypothetical protein